VREVYCLLDPFVTIAGWSPKDLSISITLLMCKFILVCLNYCAAFCNSFPNFQFLNHLGGPTLEVAFQQAAVGMMGYMTELEKIEIDPAVPVIEKEVEGQL
jgi:hypothetical protein